MTPSTSSTIAPTGGHPMTAMTAAPVSVETFPSLDWIRPWYPAGADVYTGRIFGHLSPDCEELLRVEVDPREGSGWLDPRAGAVCKGCLYEHDPRLYADIFGTDDEDDQ